MNLLDLIPHGLTLPHVVFFDPKPVFFDYLEKITSIRNVVDAGSGVGHLSRLLAERGYKVCAIDTNERAVYEFPPFPLDATTFQYPENAIPIIARPNHTGWADPAIRQALKTAPFVLYVGLAKNVAMDLGGLRKKYTLTRQTFKAGTEGEIVIKIDNLL